MPILTLHRRQMFKLSIPYWVFINKQPIGVMQGKEANIQLPAGQYDLSVRIVLGLFKWRLHIGGSKRVTLDESQHLHLQITDRERWWNLLFNIDLMLWIARFFFILPTPWNLVYEIISNGFFILWLVRIWFIRDHYFQIDKTDL